MKLRLFLGAMFRFNAQRVLEQTRLDLTQEDRLGLSPLAAFLCHVSLGSRTEWSSCRNSMQLPRLKRLYVHITAHKLEQNCFHGVE